jgi:hypothetical protein
MNSPRKKQELQLFQLHQPRKLHQKQLSRQIQKKLRKKLPPNQLRKSIKNM